MYGGLILTSNIYFTSYSAIFISAVQSRPHKLDSCRNYRLYGKFGCEYIKHIFILLNIII